MPLDWPFPLAPFDQPPQAQGGAPVYSRSLTEQRLADDGYPDDRYVPAQRPAADGYPDDWYVPSQKPAADGYPDDWYVPNQTLAADGYPDDWYMPSQSQQPTVTRMTGMCPVKYWRTTATPMTGSYRGRRLRGSFVRPIRRRFRPPPRLETVGHASDYRMSGGPRGYRIVRTSTQTLNAPTG
jgi:hypothetical protein